MTKNGGVSKRRGGLYGWSVDARAIYPPSRQRALVAPARAESYAQLSCTITVLRARRIYAGVFFSINLAHLQIHKTDVNMMTSKIRCTKKTIYSFRANYLACPLTRFQFNFTFKLTMNIHLQ
jgi:hypothetical protein